jgi:phosphotransacetylase
MVNPDPESAPEDAHKAWPDVIIATGRSDYPNQVNNVLGFPYIFRGALAAKASTIIDAMKIAASEALAGRAREDVPEEVEAAYGSIVWAIDPLPGQRVIGLQVIVLRWRTVFIGDARVNEKPDNETIAGIAIQAATKTREMGHEPRVAFLSDSNFSNPPRPANATIRAAIQILDEQKVDFEFDGDMAADTALDYELMQRLYPFSRLTGPTNVLVMPGLHSANISAKILQEIAGGTAIGPILIRLSKPVQVVQMGATINDIVPLSALAACDAIEASN